MKVLSKTFSRWFLSAVTALLAGSLLSACATPVYESVEITPHSHQVRTPASILNKPMP